MQITEFKAWFEGFCEGVAETPTPEQWAKIKAKVADLGKSVTRSAEPDDERALKDRIEKYREGVKRGVQIGGGTTDQFPYGNHN